MAKWITFELQPDKRLRLTHIWNVVTVDGAATLGQVRWYSAWRRYAFYPVAFSVFEQDCLRDIAEFCEKSTAERKAERSKP